jgi:outer membrane protein OmpA-like peptidoglycan-associated protein
MMRTLIFLISIGVIIVPGISDISLAQRCKHTQAMLDKVMSGEPDKMTEEYFQMALINCPENPGLYDRIGKYYNKLYKEELHLEKKRAYRGKAIIYYTGGIKWAKGNLLKTMKVERARLYRTKDFDPNLIKALKPVPVPMPGMGLNLKIHFEFNSCKLTQDAQENLDELGKVLAEKKSIQISLAGHTDQSGSEVYNKELSLNRAKEAKKYLVEKYDVEQIRIQTFGYGFEFLADFSDPYGAENRRVEVQKLSD